MKVGFLLIVMAVVLIAAGALFRFCFDYSLNYAVGLDVPPALDIVAGVFSSPVLIPVTVVLAVLDYGGVEGPLFGSKTKGERR